ncbi:glycoside hydrolase family 113 [Halalkalibacterium halodurans]|uniref:glycoside hydrolase family 113 n=1 Tax=Halalkalibacterium halodurans TaxID=86665 RepID=UPI002AA9709E|nr:1,4-beta-xylanase [Halalkalibacterium halodurans]MDY7222671.1 1,4-beta-xylanase [Halalkalibacterium halodurans]MDY7241892.1 1,4-beta-xylanase [Halalkalibacterium halodurans]
MDYIKGMTWGWVGVRGTWMNEEAKQSMETMKHHLAVNWTAVAFQGLQETAQSTEIEFNQGSTVSDDEVYWAIEEAKNLGLNVCLKPVVNCKDGTWRAHINFFDLDVPCEPKWSDWFRSYEAFILHYAKIAELTNCEMFCIGCEMVQTDRREAEWRELIKKVRAVYSGLITYNCDKYQEGQVKWWDAVDIISSSGYYPIDSWDEQIPRIKAIVEQAGKPFFFMEAGCPSRTGSAMVPNDWNLNKGQVNMEEQDRYFKVMFNKLANEQWCRGFMLWDWPAKLYDKKDAESNDDYCIYGKKAEKTIKAFYLSK